MKHWFLKRPADAGLQAENAAAEFLQQQGCKLLYRNFACRLGEIDLIILDQSDLVFVEVRHRKNSAFGTPSETLTQTKQQRLLRTAEYFRHSHPKFKNTPCRFDMIASQPSSAQGGLELEWIKNAFGA